MAEWRSLGYVADSDEEEESPSSLQEEILTPQKICLEDDDTGSRDGRSPPNDVGNRKNEEVGFLAIKNGSGQPKGEHSKEGEREHQERETVGSKLDGNHGTEVETPDHQICSEDSLHDDGDIDELQEDHYRYAPTAQLEAELLQGSRELASPAPSPDRPTIRRLLPPGYASSAYLSAAREAPRQIPPIPNQGRGFQDDITNNAGTGSQGISTCPTVVLPANATESSIEPRKVTRTLRHRNPIQLHPYAIEGEKYRKILHARGLKSIRVDDPKIEAMDSRRKESQGMEDDYSAEESQEVGTKSDQHHPMSSSPLQTQDSDTASDSTHRDVFVFGEDDDLPDMDTLLRESSHKISGNGYKRRKIASSSFRTLPRLSHPIQKIVPGNTLRSLSNDDDDHVMFDVPPSPPHSESRTPQKRLKLPTLRHLERPSKTLLPTPVTSSEPRRRSDLAVSKSESSDARYDRPRSMTLSETSDTDSTCSETDQSPQMQRVQRKIRGVLPASWLKLDLKARQKKPQEIERAQRSLSPERTLMQRGVARPVSRHGVKSSDRPASRNGAFVLSDGEESVPDGEDLQQRLLMESRIENNGDQDFLDDRYGEAAENDHVDAMLPSAARSGFQRTKTKRRQSKIADFRSHPRPPEHEISKALRRDHPRSRKTKGLDERLPKKPKSLASKLSILDAPSMKTPLQNAIPRFLKVASRTVRSRNDKGRHSPSQKYIRLATKEDDQAASETLENWREGTIMPSVKYKSSTQERQPLLPRSANSTLPPSPPKPRKNQETRKDCAAKSAPRKRQQSSTRGRKFQMSLDQLVQRQAREPATFEDHTHPLQQREEPKRRGQLVSSITTNADSRPAMLESAGENEGELHAQTMFQRDLSRINCFDDESGLSNVFRLFDERDSGQNPELSFVHRKISNAQPKKAVPHRSRKRPPRHRDISIPWPRQPSVPINVDELPNAAVSQSMSKSSVKDVITGLGPFGARYSDTFDVRTLPIGICFHGDTFVGSGSFAKSLRRKDQSKLDSIRGHTLLQCGKTYRWGPWNDAVSTELGEVLALVGPTSEDQVSREQSPGTATSAEPALTAFKGIIVYLSDQLSFLDPIDRVSCVQRCKALLTTIPFEQGGCHIDHIAEAMKATRKAYMQHFIQKGTMKVVLANQVRQLSQHTLVPSRLQEEVSSMLQHVAQQIMSLATKDGLEEFERCITDSKLPDADGYLIRNHQTSIEAFVVARHVLWQDANDSVTFWQKVAFKTPTKTPHSVLDIGLLEDSWKRLFTLLPFFELDVHGTLEMGARFKTSFDNWQLVKTLINPVLEVSLSNPRGQAPSFNVYCRALFGRCLHLINGWGWRQCESIIGTLFDFFARNNLAHLRNEESRGSPPFLEHLADSPSLHTQPGDRCFHIFLKIIGSGIRHMRDHYSEKKIRDLVWRLMPNHGRSHPKEEAIRQEDIDALRNHHDLLCTLYWASPSSCRPRLNVIRNLVQLESAHREACHISIRAWSNLVKFQLSTDESITHLQPFAEWHDNILVQLVHQHDLARTEAEDQVKLVQHSGGPAISSELLESTIAANQRQVEAILSDALASLKLAVDVAQSEESASVIMSMTLAKVFGVLDPGKPQAAKTTMLALDVLIAFASKSTMRISLGSHQENDDSQEYGDWTAFEEDDDRLPAVPVLSNELPLQKFQEPLRQLLSNCFGSDIIPEDPLLLKIVDLWVSMARVLVINGARSWSDYLDRFGKESWSSLRDTEQTRKFSAYYLATLIEKVPGIMVNHGPSLLSSWMTSLVERESMLKFQYRLTESLLNSKYRSPILQNLPFWTDSSTGRFQISATEFSERRLSLISSILSNLRVSLEEALRGSPSTAQLRQEYKDLLKHMMATMKHNYLELGNASNFKGAYVDFVHRVVAFLQQHTSTICPIDRFFTDNGAFPLPATDPTYVVAQLKNYALRLHDPKTPKQITVFLQSVSERAAIDGQQQYLVGQLEAAITKVFEDGSSTRPTLRCFLVKAIIPAYIETACTTANPHCGWILALPYLQALRSVFGELLLDLDGSNSDSVAAVASTLTAFLSSLQRAFDALLPPSKLLKETGILKLISACFSTVTALLPTLDYIERLCGPTGRAASYVQRIKNFAVHVSALVQHHDFDPQVEEDAIGDQPYADIRSFARQELTDTLTKNWYYDNHEQQYYFSKGGSRGQVAIDIGLYEEEKAGLLKVLEGFFECLGGMPAFCDDDDETDVMMRRNMVTGLGAWFL